MRIVVYSGCEGSSEMQVVQREDGTLVALCRRKGSQYWNKASKEYAGYIFKWALAEVLKERDAARAALMPVR